VDSGRGYRTTVDFGFGGPRGRPPQDLVAVLAALFTTFALQFFASTAIVPALLRLTPAVWRAGFLWQPFTYAFVGFGGPSPWILVELFVLYWFGGDVRSRLGRTGFWRLLAWAVPCAAAAAVLVQLAAEAIGGASPTPFPFQLMQGQRMLLVVVISAFATLYGDATILLFFVLPMKARWFLWFSILIGFVAYLGSKDLAGFAGICAGTGITVLVLSPSRLQRAWRRRWLERRRTRLERRVDRLAKRRGLRVVRPDDRPKGPTIN